MCPVVLFLMWATFLVSFPISKLLDKLLGEKHITRFNNDQLKNLVLLHSANALKQVEENLPEGISGLTEA
jgi:metal transporter CNNM